MSEQLTALDKLEYQVELFWCLEGVMHRRKEWTIADLLKDFALGSCVLDRFLLGGHFDLLENFHCVQMTLVDAIFLPDEVDSTIRTSSEQLDEVKILHIHFLIGIQVN